MNKAEKWLKDNTKFLPVTIPTETWAAFVDLLQKYIDETEKKVKPKIFVGDRPILKDFDCSNCGGWLTTECVYCPGCGKEIDWGKG